MHLYCKLPLSVELAAGTEDVHVCLVNVIFLCGAGNWHRRCTCMFGECYISVWSWQLAQKMYMYVWWMLSFCVELAAGTEDVHVCLVNVIFLCGAGSWHRRCTCMFGECYLSVWRWQQLWLAQEMCMNVWWKLPFCVVSVNIKSRCMCSLLQVTSLCGLDNCEDWQRSSHSKPCFLAPFLQTLPSLVTL